MIKIQKTLFFKSKAKPFLGSFFLQKSHFSSINEQRKLDMQTKNTHLKVDLENPFGNEEFDSKPTEWKRYWNIHDDPDFMKRVI